MMEQAIWTLAHELCMVRPLQHQQPIKSEQWRKSAECRQAKGILKLALAIDCLHQQHEPSHCMPGRKNVNITLALLAQVSRANFKTQLNASCKKGAAAIVSQQARACKPHLTACAVIFLICFLFMTVAHTINRTSLGCTPIPRFETFCRRAPTMMILITELPIV